MALFLSEMLDVARLEQLVADGYISRQTHPTAPLAIYNYTPRTQYERLWTPETLACRGLIATTDGSVVARPFPKFFNLEEHPRSDILFSKPFRVTEKVDGSLGIIYWNEHDSVWQVATRGSFASDQARHATAKLADYVDVTRPDSLAAGVTYLVEIIYPENRVVIDYRGRDELVLLTIIDNETGADLPNVLGTQQDDGGWILDFYDWPGPVVRSHASSAKPREVAEKLGVDDGQHEGFVLAFDWPKGKTTRVKVKLEEYKRLHRIVTGLTERAVWEVLSSPQSDLRQAFEGAPDEAYDWIQRVAGNLRDRYAAIESECATAFDICVGAPSRREFAEAIARNPRRAVLFKMLDGHDYAPLIWQELRPGHAPFSSAATEEAE